MTTSGSELRAAVRNIEEVVGLERAAARRRSLADRIADGIASFVCTVTFVLLHLAHPIRRMGISRAMAV